MRETNEIISALEKAGSVKNTEGMQRYGIRFRKAYGVKREEIKALAVKYRYSTPLAVELWGLDIHEAYLLAPMIIDPEDFTPAVMDKWVHSLYSWDVCDSMMNRHLLKNKTFIKDKVFEYAQSDREFVRRAAFSLIVYETVHHKKAPDALFEEYLALIVEHSTDDRNFVKKAVNWALRQIGKRNRYLNFKALNVAGELKGSENKTRRWIGTDAYRELTDPKILRRIKD